MWRSPGRRGRRLLILTSLLITAVMLTTTAPAGAASAVPRQEGSSDPIRPSANATQQRPPAAKAPVIEVVPAFDDGLPKGEATFDVPAKAAGLAAAWSCSVYVSDPIRSYYDIQGEGDQICSGTGWSPQRLAISIQRQRWYGWQTLDTEYTAYTSSYWVSDVMWYDCYNSGTWTYRVIVTGYAAGGRYGKTVQSANYLRTTC